MTGPGGKLKYALSIAGTAGAGLFGALPGAVIAGLSYPVASTVATDSLVSFAGALGVAGGVGVAAFGILAGMAVAEDMWDRHSGKPINGTRAASPIPDGASKPADMPASQPDAGPLRIDRPRGGSLRAALKLG